MSNEEKSWFRKHYRTSTIVIFILGLLVLVVTCIEISPSTVQQNSQINISSNNQSNPTNINSQIILSSEDAGDILVFFLNKKVNGGVTYVSSVGDSYLYEVTVNYKNQNVLVYITKDGKYFIQKVVLINNNSEFISGIEAGKQLVSYLNTKMSGGVEYTSYSDIGDLYEIMVSYKNQTTPAYITKDGKYFVQDAVPIINDLTTDTQTSQYQQSNSQSTL